jgi:uncharacterized protein
MLFGDRAIERTDGFAAGGSLPRQHHISAPDARRRIRLIAEMGILFILAPIVMRIAVFDYQVPLFYALPPVLVLMMVFLFADDTFWLKRELLRGFSFATLFSIVILFAIGAAVVVYGVAKTMPDKLFALASERPGKWLKIMTLYPFTSVLAQEFVYRVFFFHRYGPLFRTRAMLILANALAFGFGHILFRNWIAVVATVLGGVLFAWRYERTRSFWAVWAEHTLWGWLVFTVGLGVYFFTGVKNPSW